jgi:hypothetical protein
LVSRLLKLSLSNFFICSICLKKCVKKTLVPWPPQNDPKTDFPKYILRSYGRAT